MPVLMARGYGGIMQMYPLHKEKSVAKWVTERNWRFSAHSGCVSLPYLPPWGLVCHAIRFRINHKVFELQISFWTVFRNDTIKQKEVLESYRNLISSLKCPKFLYDVRDEWRVLKDFDGGDFFCHSVLPLFTLPPLFLCLTVWQWVAGSCRVGGGALIQFILLLDGDGELGK